MDVLIENIFKISDSIRYICLYVDEVLTIEKREGIQDASLADSDKYEELFVNPAILKLAGQRGRLDCGGLNYVVIRYGNFYQLIRDYKNGHLSICIDKKQNPIGIAGKIEELLGNP
jgi:hypothetical protein